MSKSTPILRIVLFEPEIPPNTGNLIRLCANTGLGLHLVEPLGFSMDTKALRRAGLDYHESASVQIHADFETCVERLTAENSHASQRLFAVTTKGSVPYVQPEYQAGDVLIFGPETRGLPDAVLQDERMHQNIRIPMIRGSRSLNLSNSAAILSYEALRQLSFPDMN